MDSSRWAPSEKPPTSMRALSSVFPSRRSASRSPGFDLRFNICFLCPQPDRWQWKDLCNDGRRRLADRQPLLPTVIWSRTRISCKSAMFSLRARRASLRGIKSQLGLFVLYRHVVERAHGRNPANADGREVSAMQVSGHLRRLGTWLIEGLALVVDRTVLMIIYITFRGGAGFSSAPRAATEMVTPSTPNRPRNYNISSATMVINHLRSRSCQIVCDLSYRYGFS